MNTDTPTHFMGMSDSISGIIYVNIHSFYILCMYLICLWLIQQEIYIHGISIWKLQDFLWVHLN